MLERHRDKILEELPDGALLLDVGGWAYPLERADWVLDLMPYETRGLYGRSDPARERFTAATWVARDICDKAPWPFEDDQFDYVICSHTLEDIRDPIWVCEELSRVAKAGYVEFPSRVQEHCWGVDGEWAGWNHHRWVCEAERDAARVRFTMKYDILHLPQFHFPAGTNAALSAEQKVDWLFWEGSFEAYEKIYMDPPELFAELEAFMAAHRNLVPERRGGLMSRLRRS